MDNTLLTQLLTSAVLVSLINALAQIIAKRIPAPREPTKPAEAIATISPAFLKDYETIIAQLREQTEVLQEQITAMRAEIVALTRRAESAEANERALYQEVRELRRQINGSATP